MIFAVGCSVRFQCQHSTLFSSVYATLQTDTDKFEKLQLKFKFLIARRNLISDPLRNRNPCLGRDPSYGNHWLKPVSICRFVSFNRILYFKEV